MKRSPWFVNILHLWKLRTIEIASPDRLPTSRGLPELPKFTDCRSPSRADSPSMGRVTNRHIADRWWPSWGACAYMPTYGACAFMPTYGHALMRCRKCIRGSAGESTTFLIALWALKDNSHHMFGTDIYSETQSPSLDRGFSARVPAELFVGLCWWRGAQYQKPGPDFLTLWGAVSHGRGRRGSCFWFQNAPFLAKKQCSSWPDRRAPQNAQGIIPVTAVTTNPSFIVEKGVWDLC